jgi:hypothetical protein
MTWHFWNRFFLWVVVAGFTSGLVLALQDSSYVSSLWWWACLALNGLGVVLWGRDAFPSPPERPSEPAQACGDRYPSDGTARCFKSVGHDGDHTDGYYSWRYHR